METKTVNTVPASAMPTQEDLVLYRFLYAAMDNLCRTGEVDTQTRDRANAVLAMKTGLKQTSIFL